MISSQSAVENISFQTHFLNFSSPVQTKRSTGVYAVNTICQGNIKVFGKLIINCNKEAVVCSKIVKTLLSQALIAVSLHCLQLVNQNVSFLPCAFFSNISINQKWSQGKTTDVFSASYSNMQERRMIFQRGKNTFKENYSWVSPVSAIVLLRLLSRQDFFNMLGSKSSKTKERGGGGKGNNKICIKQIRRTSASWTFLQINELISWETDVGNRCSLGMRQRHFFSLSCFIWTLAAPPPTCVLQMLSSC